MKRKDPFKDLARHYDTIMEHVDYDRWFEVTSGLGALLPQPFRHLDAGCGTGVLLERLNAPGWNGFGMDLSAAMLQQGRKCGRTAPVVRADLRALPFQGAFNLISCLFDSINFLLEEEEMKKAFRELAGALDDGGLLYFDIVTERMILEHFDGQTWTEESGDIETTWSSAYDRNSGVNDARIKVNAGRASSILERIYAREAIESALDRAGLEILGIFDAFTWRSPTKRTTRIDWVAAKKPSRTLHRRFARFCARRLER